MSIKHRRVLRFIFRSAVIATMLFFIAIIIPPSPIRVGAASSPPPLNVAPMGFHSMGTIALCLSGGGYRAALFDVGALKRLNDIGLLKHVDHVSSVSGGSIVGAYLVLHWGDLRWEGIDGAASNFDDVITTPFRALADTSIEKGALAMGLLGTKSVARQVAAAYETTLFTKHETLNDLPKSPKLVINATRLEDGSLWTFGQDGIAAADWPTNFENGATGDDHRLPLSVAVASSSAYPPFLAPMILDMTSVVPTAQQLRNRFGNAIGPNDPDREHFLSKYVSSWSKMAAHVSLVDGGVLNNLATEWCSGTGLTFVVDAAAPDELVSIGRPWSSVVLQVIEDMMSAKEASHNELKDSNSGVMSPRSVVIRLKDALSLSKYGAYRQPLSDLQKIYVKKSLSVSQMAALPTALRSLRSDEQNNLLNLGYLIADFAMLQRLQSTELGTDTLRTLTSDALKNPLTLPAKVPSCLQSERNTCDYGKNVLIRLDHILN
jgi:NTE family protein